MARPRVAAAGAVGWVRGYASGYEDGYEAGYLAALDSANQAWREESGRKVFVAGELLQQPTAAERKAERVAVLLEGHRAGFHVTMGRWVPDCPSCRERV